MHYPPLADNWPDPSSFPLSLYTLNTESLNDYLAPDEPPFPPPPDPNLDSSGYSLPSASSCDDNHLHPYPFPTPLHLYPGLHRPPAETSWVTSITPNNGLAMINIIYGMVNRLQKVWEMHGFPPAGTVLAPVDVGMGMGAEPVLVTIFEALLLAMEIARVEADLQLKLYCARQLGHKWDRASSRLSYGGLRERLRAWRDKRYTGSMHTLSKGGPVPRPGVGMGHGEWEGTLVGHVTVE